MMVVGWPAANTTAGCLVLPVKSEGIFSLKVKLKQKQKKKNNNPVALAIALDNVQSRFVTFTHTHIVVR